MKLKEFWTNLLFLGQLSEGVPVLWSRAAVLLDYGEQSVRGAVFVVRDHYLGVRGQWVTFVSSRILFASPHFPSKYACNPLLNFSVNSLLNGSLSNLISSSSSNILLILVLDARIFSFNSSLFILLMIFNFFFSHFDIFLRFDWSYSHFLRFSTKWAKWRSQV